MALTATALSPAPSRFLIIKGQRCLLHCSLSMGAWNHPKSATWSVRPLPTMASFHEPHKVMTHINNAREKLWELTPRSVKDFPWKKAERIMLQQTLLVGWEALKWCLLAVYVCSSVSDVLYTISRNRELMIPFGLFVGCMATNFLTETSQELFPITEDNEWGWYLVSIGCFFVLIKIIAAYFVSRGRLFLLHTANGGLMQLLWIWKSSTEKQDRDSSAGMQNEQIQSFVVN